MFGMTVANSGSDRHRKYVENTADMTVRLVFPLLVTVCHRTV